MYAGQFLYKWRENLSQQRCGSTEGEYYGQTCEQQRSFKENERKKKKTLVPRIRKRKLKFLWHKERGLGEFSTYTQDILKARMIYTSQL